jgi:Pyruvate/2-oxoacid:ferredoxin oxidoreductase gamma subunit
VLYEADDEIPREQVEPHLGTGEKSRWIAVPFTRLAKESAGTALAKNIVTLGVMTELFGLPRAGLLQALTRKFSAKKAEVLKPTEEASGGRRSGPRTTRRTSRTSASNTPPANRSC